jgi:hypothetical protein
MWPAKSQKTENIREEDASVGDVRSNYGSIPGAEFPTALYASIVAAFAWMLAVMWLAFGGNIGTDLNLAVVTLLTIVFFGIPIIMHHMVAGRLEPVPMRVKSFLSSRIDIATGPMSARQAWLEVLLIPLALAIGATLIGTVYVWVG